MPRYVVLSKFTDASIKTLRDNPELSELRNQVESIGGRLVDQHYLLGRYDVFSVIDVHEGDAAQLLSLSTRASRVVMPAINQDLFVRLLGRTGETTGPHRWQANPVVRSVRRGFRKQIYTRPFKEACSKFSVAGREHVEALRGPAIFISNHTSHLDGPAMFNALPNYYKNRIAFAAAADRFYIKGRKELKKQGWWFSLAWNMFPMKRGGGRAALEHAEFLIDRGMSIGIFPEGGRASHDKLARFRVGPALLAMAKEVPVVPMYMDGLRHIRPKGTSVITPGPINVYIGAPLRIERGTDAKHATSLLEASVKQLQAQAHAAGL